MSCPVEIGWFQGISAYRYLFFPLSIQYRLSHRWPKFHPTRHFSSIRPHLYRDWRGLLLFRAVKMSKEMRLKMKNILYPLYYIIYFLLCQHLYICLCIGISQPLLNFQRCNKFYSNNHISAHHFYTCCRICFCKALTQILIFVFHNLNNYIISYCTRFF